jgi:transposase
MTDEMKKIFLNPTNVTHKKYEVLRALCVEKIPAKEAAERFAYSLSSVNAMKRDFNNALKKQRIDSDYFFITHCPGRKEDREKSAAKKRIIELRKQNYSILDIKSIIHTEGNVEISHDYIHRVLLAEGYARLPKRSQLERRYSSAKILKAPRSQAIEWGVDNDKIFHSERGIGVLPFLPLLAWLGVDKWISLAGYPETSELNSVQNVLSFIALKLAGHNRYSKDDLWAMDRGFGLFSGLNVLPKDSTLSSYSYRTNHNINRKFLQAMFQRLDELGVITGQINMDFTAIPHWGDASVLEKNWSGKRGKALKSVLAVLCQDSDTGIFCYSDAEVKHNKESECVLEFIDFWKEKGRTPSCLIFDSKFTTYQNLERLDRDNIKFITLRRRSKKLLADLQKMPKGSWLEVKVEGNSRKYNKLMVHESEITLPKTNCLLRQIIISGNGREKETFLITNDKERTAAQIIRQYGKRWNIEKGIAEQIGFFHLNSLSSSVVVKVDFDLTMTIAAHNFYRIIAQKLPGFEKECSASLNSKFFTNGGQFQIKGDSIIVEMKKKRHLPLLIDALSSIQNVAIPWLNNKNMTFHLWATS